MIGDPPNIMIGNILAKYLDFNDFLFILGASMLLALLVQSSTDTLAKDLYFNALLANLRMHYTCFTGTVQKHKY